MSKREKSGPTDALKDSVLEFHSAQKAASNIEAFNTQSGKVATVAVPIGSSAEACARAGENLTASAWTRHLGARPYQRSCPDHPAG